MCSADKTSTGQSKLPCPKPLVAEPKRGVSEPRTGTLSGGGARDPTPPPPPQDVDAASRVNGSRRQPAVRDPTTTVSVP